MEACPSNENTTGNTSTPPPSPRGAATFVGSSDGDEVACLSGAVDEIDPASGKLIETRPRPYRGRQKSIYHEKLLCVGTRGTLTFYAHLTNRPIATQTLACIMVGLYEDKIQQRSLADRESFVLVSVEADEAEVAVEAKAEVEETEIGDPWVAKLVAPAGAARSAAPIRRASVELLGVRHMAFYAKTYTAEYLLTSFLELCETVVDGGELVLVDAAWSGDQPAECLAFTTKNRDAPRPLALRPFASLVAGALGRHGAVRPVSWHPSARFIRYFDPKICYE